MVLSIMYMFVTYVCIYICHCCTHDKHLMTHACTCIRTHAHTHTHTHYHMYSCVRVWDIHTGKLKHTLTGHTEEIEVHMYTLYVLYSAGVNSLFIPLLLVRVHVFCSFL